MPVKELSIPRKGLEGYNAAVLTGKPRKEDGVKSDVRAYVENAHSWLDKLRHQLLRFWLVAT
jgi:hypothetical protein